MSGTSTSLQESLATFIASPMTSKRRRTKRTKGRWYMYYCMQSQKVKEMQNSREVKIMATDTDHMTLERQGYFAQEITRIARERR